MNSYARIDRHGCSFWRRNLDGTLNRLGGFEVNSTVKLAASGAVVAVIASWLAKKL